MQQKICATLYSSSEAIGEEERSRASCQFNLSRLSKLPTGHWEFSSAGQVGPRAIVGRLNWASGRARMGSVHWSIRGTYYSIKLYAMRTPPQDSIFQKQF